MKRVVSGSRARCGSGQATAAAATIRAAAANPSVEPYEELGASSMICLHRSRRVPRESLNAPDDLSKERRCQVTFGELQSSDRVSEELGPTPIATFSLSHQILT